MQSTVLTPAERTRRARVLISGEAPTPRLRRFAEGIERELLQHGHSRAGESGQPTLVLNVIDAARPRPYRRSSQGTFVVSVAEVTERPDDVLRAAYPVLVRSLSNLLLYLAPGGDGEVDVHFVTLEQGAYAIPREATPEDLYREIYRRLAPLAASRLVINNHFIPDLEPSLWNGNEHTRALAEGGRKLDALDLLPAPFPLAQILGEKDMAHVKRLFGLGGLSYGNLSVREDETRFWMSARGVDKGKLSEIGRDMLLITDYDRAQDAMLISVPPEVEPRAASVDSIEHWTLYREHPEIGAIIHVHAWMDGVSSTRVNYPCGTYELAREVAALAGAAPDPSSCVVGLKNHGLTITGRSLEEIFERIDGRILPQVPME
ncbi:MAG TPA: class II aldolase/adducin family protein [Longimicrobiaceae bacterium]|nr:class II aldolase/adducin family protein [Longimicrobiaceae bacterium]